MLKYQTFALFYFLTSATEFTVADVPVRVVNGSSFRLDLFPQTLDNPVTCTFTNVQNVPYDFPFDNNTGDDTVTSGSSTIQILGNGHCAVRVHSAHSRTDAGRFRLSLTNGEETVSESFRVTFVSRDIPQNRTTSAELGTSRVTILCGPSDNMLYCEFRDPSGNIVESTHRTRCQVTIDILVIRHFGLWTCTVGLLSEPSEIFATHLITWPDSGNVQNVVISSNETRLGTFISWRVNGLSGTAAWCRAFAPNGETILVLPGIETEKFISAATDLTENRCGLIINGEFPGEYNGLWRLEIGVNNRRAMGGFLKMPEGKVPRLEDYLNTRNQSHPRQITELNIQPRQQFRINCQTNYSASYCWIGGPNGQQFTQSENLTVGRCSQMVNGSDFTQHNGIWSCNMAHIDGGAEEQFLTKVNVIENHFRAVESEVGVSLQNYI